MRFLMALIGFLIHTALLEPEPGPKPGTDCRWDQRAAFLSLPRTGTTVVIVGRTASADTGLGGAVSFLGFLTILLLFC